MTTYVAFLRGINVGAHNRLTMDDLRDTLETLGFERVRTYLASGNVAFEAAGTDAATVADEVTDAIHEAFGYDVPVMVRTRAELAAVVDGQPFAESSDGETKRYVAFLGDDPADERVSTLDERALPGETFVVRGREVYSELRPAELGNGRFTDVGDVLGVPATRRTWAVVRKVLDLASR
jgi:uncharacterized protein (DUF1697 family)